MSEELKNDCSTESCSSDCSTCGCDCGSSTTNTYKTITLTLEDHSTVTCAVVTTFPVDDKNYIVLLPLDEKGENHDGEIYMYGFSTTENGQPILTNIEDDDEYKKAADALGKILDQTMM